ncbi:MAG: hypothetical protein AAGN46_04410 [Acidobacteriota bacterium]
MTGAAPEADARRPAGAYIVLAGIDGAGKSTQGGLLRKALHDSGHQAYFFDGKEDFAVQVMRTVAAAEGASVRGHFGNEAVDLAKAFDTLRDVTHLVRPLTARGGVVVQPRSGYCRIALAISMGSANVEQVAQVTHFAGEPDLTFWLDTPVDVCLQRIERRAIDSEDPSMLRGFREAMAQLWSSYPEWVRVDGNRPVDAVHADIWAGTKDWLARREPELIRRSERAADE